MRRRHLTLASTRRAPKQSLQAARDEIGSVLSSVEGPLQDANDTVLVAFDRAVANIRPQVDKWDTVYVSFCLEGKVEGGCPFGCRRA